MRTRLTSMLRIAAGMKSFKFLCCFRWRRNNVSDGISQPGPLGPHSTIGQSLPFSAECRQADIGLSRFQIFWLR